MEILGLDLDNSPHIAKNKSLRYAQNITIDNKGESYFNERGFELIGQLDDILKNHPSNRHIIPYIYNDATYHEYKIIGTIPTNIGVVLFCVVEYWDSEDKSDVQRNNAIIYITTENNDPIVKRCLYGSETVLNFSIDRPIHGDYIYNYKENLIITFTEGVSDDANETRIINLTDPFYDGNNGNDTALGWSLSENEVNSFNLIPNVIYPELSYEINDGGNLKTGAYQIAIKYRLNDGTYTNYSPLTPSIIICGDYEEDYQLGIEINKNITVSFNNNNIEYKYCRFAIVYIDDESQLVYETSDILINSDITNYIINDLSSFESISLDDIFIKNISYIKDNSLVNFNNRLIRGNVKTLNYKDLDADLKDFTNNHLNVSLSWKLSSEYINTTKRYFKSGEVYVLYAAYYDYKGDLVNIHHIPWKENNYDIESFIIGNTDNKAHKIPYLSKISDDKLTPIWDGPEGYYIDVINKYNINLESESTEIRRLYFLSTNYIKNNIEISHITYDKHIKIPDIELEYNNGLNTGGLNPKNYQIRILKIENKNNEPKIIGLQIEPTLVGISMLPAGVTLGSKIYDVTDLINKLDNTTELKDYYEISESKLLKSDRDTSSGFESRSLVNNINTIINMDANSEKYLLTYFYIEDSNPGSTPPSLEFIANITYKDSGWTLQYSLYPIINIEADLSNKTELMNKYINNIVYLFVEHNINNSRILTQGFALRDTEVNNFGKGQTYKNPFGGNNARIYTFEYLYNQINSIKAKMKPLYFNTDKLKFITNPNLDRDAKVFIVNNASGEDPQLTNDVNESGTRYLDVNIEDLKLDLSQYERNVILEYIITNISSQNNIAGDSYYRIENGFIGFSKANEDWLRGFIADFINDSDALYSDIYNQKLQIASSIIDIKNNNSKITTNLIGDTFLSYITLRATAPDSGYRYGDANHKTLDSNATVYRWIFTVPLESKFNALARYSINSVDKSFKYHNKTGNELRELYQLSYQIDNFINTNVGKGYSTVYNENGIETFTYYDEIPGTQDHPYRIIRSQLQSAENANLNWRLFKSDDYKDMPFNRGEIISLKTNNKNLYIQQAYGLHLLQLRDTLSNTDEGTSYLGTSDIFNMEPQEVTYSPSGYIGCQSYFDTHINVIGYFVIDAVHKRIFSIDGNKVTNLTALNAIKWFDKNLIKDIKNPFINNGRYWVFNEDTNILILVQNCEENKFTISYSPIKNCWLSFHTYNPIIGITNRNGVFWFNNDSIYAISKTNYGKYLSKNDIYPSIIKILLNDNIRYNKLLNNITWKDRVDIINKLVPTTNEFTKTINSILIHNDNQCSDRKLVKFNDKWYDSTTGVNKINLWRFNEIYDVHKSIPFMINETSVDQNALKLKPKWYDVNKFICQFVYCIMQFNNDNNNELWEIIDIDPEWILDNRNNQR